MMNPKDLVEIKIGHAYAKTEEDAMRLAGEYYRYGNVTKVERDEYYSPMCSEWNGTAWVSNYWIVYGKIGKPN